MIMHLWEIYIILYIVIEPCIQPVNPSDKIIFLNNSLSYL